MIALCFAIFVQENGRFRDTGPPGGLDLVEEWREPRSGTFWVNVFSGGNVSVPFFTREQANQISAVAGKRIACIEVKWKEGDGL